MGVNLTPIIEKRVVSLDDLRGRSFAVDAYVVLHQFLALIRTRDGSSLTDAEGRVTSHLVGLAFRTTRLVSDYDMELTFVFDGKPPDLKRAEVERRRESRARAEEEYRAAAAAGDTKTAFSKAVMTGRLTREGVEDAKRLLTLLGIPWVQAPGEGEAQAAHLARKGEVWASNSQDYDSLLYGAPRLVRFLTIQGEEWLPSKGQARKLEPWVIDLDGFLAGIQLTREQLVDAAILIGTDYNAGVKGVGPKTAVKLIRKHGSLEGLPSEIRGALDAPVEAIRDQFRSPQVTDKYNLTQRQVDEEGLTGFLCGERGFSRDRVRVVAERMKRARSQSRLSDWVGP